MGKIDKWEYMITTIYGDDDWVENGFNKMGQDGWELCAVKDCTLDKMQCNKYILKRKINE